jgi:DNA-binding PadR family transcriptional regulator
MSVGRLAISGGGNCLALAGPSSNDNRSHDLTSMYLASMFLAMNLPTPLPRRSALGLLVLTQLMSEPMHVYRMQKLFEDTGKDRVVNVRSRASLYQTLDRLLRHDLVEVTETVRVEGYPDRVVYGVTDAGRTVAGQWLREMLHSTDDEYPEFIAALSLMFVLPPEDTLAELELRAENLDKALADTQSALAGAPQGLPRLFLLEEEYRRALLQAELDWLNGVIADLRAQRLSWSEEWLREVAATFVPPTDDHNQEEA